ncbi:MAG: peptide chain release factor N(5)-glutamine methyltransferase [Phycisphaerales bacterium]
MPAADTKSWTTRSLLEWSGDYFKRKGVDSPRLTAELLLAHVLGCERMRLYMEIDRPASQTDRDTLRPLVERIGKHEPLQYVIAEGWLYGRPFSVSQVTLIPRPSTETLIDVALSFMNERERDQPLRILDIGTGTGCIAITLALEAKEKTCEIVASDIDAAIIELAQRNALRHRVENRISFIVSRIFDEMDAYRDPGFDLIVANPPYIPDHEWNDVPRNVRDYEPASALRGGPDGLNVIGPLIEQAPQFLGMGGRLCVEIAHCQAKEAVARAARAGLKNARVHADHEGLQRVLVADGV